MSNKIKDIDIKNHTHTTFSMVHWIHRIHNSQRFEIFKN